MLDIRKIEVRTRLAALIATVSFLFFLLTVWKTLSLSANLSVPVPWLDQWVTVFKQLSGRELSVNDYFVQHNEHRIPLTLLIDVADMKFMGGLECFCAKCKPPGSSADH